MRGETKKINNLLKRRLNNTRLSVEEVFYLYKNAPLGLLMKTALQLKINKFGKKIFYIKNIHIEPTNYCIYKCKFCSFHKEPSEPLYWQDELDVLIEKLNKTPESIREIHITGGVHPNRDVSWYEKLLKEIKKIRPFAQIKAFTAVEINYMCKKAGRRIDEGLILLKNAGLDSLAGGGAEIFNANIRQQLCPEKGDAATWLSIHKQAHKLGIVSNATMLYGHIETIEHRLEHMQTIRDLQDETGGFNCFIPLKFRHQENYLSHLKELPFIEDIKLFAISRIFFDNITHIKAYWPMIGREKAALLFSAGVDDMDGTIYDSTKIYTMAGSEEQLPMITVTELKNIIEKENFIPVERDLFYQEIT